jgi:hypothetical protein
MQTEAQGAILLGSLKCVARAVVCDARLQTLCACKEDYLGFSPWGYDAPRDFLSESANFWYQELEN